MLQNQVSTEYFITFSLFIKTKLKWNRLKVEKIVQFKKRISSFINTAVRRIHTSKSTTDNNDNLDGFEIEQGMQQTLSTPNLRRVTWFAIIGRETRKRQCYRADLWPCGLFSPPSRRMQCWMRRISRVSWCFSLRPPLISMDYLFCYLDIHLFLN